MYALIQKSDNQILRVAQEGTALSEAKPFQWIQCPDACNNNWTYDGENFIEPVVPEPEPYIPQSVSMRQARLALLQSGLLATVDAAIASGTEADKITWEYATEVNRSDALVSNMAAALNMSDSDLDNLFTLAATL